MAAAEPIRVPRRGRSSHSRRADPQLLPLAGSPRLVVVGREVRLGSGYADLIGVEPTGRISVIEIKLAGNPESRRAVVSQVLGYAAYLYGMQRQDLEHLLAPHLARRGVTDLFAAVEDGTLDEEDFRAAVAESLSSGRLRVVIVLDEAPDDLVQLIAFLEATSDGLIVDLITVARFDFGGQQVVVPHRVEPGPERRSARPTAQPAERATSGTPLVPGDADFRTVIASAPPDQVVFLTRLTNWAVELERRSLAKVYTYHGKRSVTTLLAYVPGDSTLVTIFRDAKNSYVALYRSVFERRAPQALAELEAVLGNRIRQGGTLRDVTDTVLGLLTRAYEEARAGHLAPERDAES